MATKVRSWPEVFGPATITKIEEARRIYPDIVKWPEEQKLLDAPQPAGIAEALITQTHDELANAQIAYVFREKLGGRGETRWGKTSKAGAHLHHFMSLDFVIEINMTIWNRLSLPRRAALVDHQLEYCGRDDNGNFMIVAVDIAEFGAVVRRWGDWQPGVTDFLSAVDAAPQLDLLAGEKAPETEAVAD